MTTPHADPASVLPSAASVPFNFVMEILRGAADHLGRVMVEHPYCDHVHVVKAYGDVWRSMHGYVREPSAEPTQDGSVGEAYIDRGDAVNLARNMLEVHDCKGITPRGVQMLAEAVMLMDAAISARSPEAQGESAAPAEPAGRSLPSKAQIDDIVYECRQRGEDTTYDIVFEAISRFAAPPAAIPAPLTPEEHQVLRSAVRDSAEVVAPGRMEEPAKWIDDPHDIEQGRMLNPEWMKLHGLTAKKAAEEEPAKTEADADGDAFRKAAELGLTLRFYGGCAQSSMPGSPCAYEVVNGHDRAASMREAVSRAATVIARGGEPQRLSGTTDGSEK